MKRNLLLAFIALLGCQAGSASQQATLGAQHDTHQEHLAFWRYDGGNPIDISEIQYTGLSTFAGVPHMRCFDKDESESSRYDIAILGAPLDTVG